MNGKCGRGAHKLPAAPRRNVKGIGVIVSIIVTCATHEIEQRTPGTELQMKGESDGRVGRSRLTADDEIQPPKLVHTSFRRGLQILRLTNVSLDRETGPAGLRR
jgi:hypothetical protein